MVSSLPRIVEAVAEDDSDALRDAGEALALCQAVQRGDSLAQASALVAQTLATQLGCAEVVVGLKAGGRRCQPQAMLSVTTFDRRSNLMRDVEAAMEECVARNGAFTAMESPGAGLPESAPLARLCDQRSATHAAAIPMPGRDGTPAGAVVCLWKGPSAAASQVVARAQRLATVAGAALDARCHGFPGAFRRTLQMSSRKDPWRRAAFLVLPLLLIASMFIPVPHVLKAVTTLQPTSLRFVAAPFDAALRASHARPGDVVSAGALLATLDGRELEWELTTLNADRDKAKRQYATRLAAGDTPSAQLAKLEGQRLSAQIALLEDRLGHVQITAPLDGIVVQGDLEREVGRPVDKGQRLFEIAPLSDMVAEVAVPAQEVSYLSDGMAAEVRLEAFPDRVWHEKVSRIWPRAEIRDARNVFVAEVALDNVERILRPGMQGRARLIVGKRSLGWVLFHRPWERLAGWLRW